MRDTDKVYPVNFVTSIYLLSEYSKLNLGTALLI